MNCRTEQIPGKWQDRLGAVPSAYRLLAFAVATAYIFVFPSAHHWVIPPVILLPGAGIYTLVKVLHPSRWYDRSISRFSLLGTDIAVCIFLVISTGGLYSSFLLYTLSPLVTAALFLDRKVTFSIAGLSGVYVIGSHVGNPFFPASLALPELSYFLVYMTAVWLTAALPYLINVNLRQQLQSQTILRERKRLSREIHDGTAQTVSVLHWRVQLLRRRLAEMDINLNEVGELERLAERAHQDMRDSLELLRNYTGNGSILSHLKDYLEHFKEETNINFVLDAETTELHLEALVELELLRICQEALTNIRKHSGAHNVQIKIKSVDGHYRVNISDDGRGFDALAYYRDGAHVNGHGLAVMRERVESIGGKFRVLSLPGQGTEVQVEVPANPRRGSLV